MADGQQLSQLHTIVRELIAAVGWREGVVTQVFDEFGPAADSSARTRRAFHGLVYSAIDALRAEYGPTADPSAARAFGLDPEAILGRQPLANVPSTIVAFAVWRMKDLWLFLAGRFCGGPDISHYVIVLGATSQMHRWPCRGLHSGDLADSPLAPQFSWNSFRNRRDSCAGW